MAFDTLDWDDLRVFLHTARAGNLSQAAKRMRLDHTTVGRRIAQFEAALGIAVFERHRSGFRLNDVGEKLLRHAESVESSVIAIREETYAGEKGKVEGIVRLATMEGIASLYFAPRFARLRAAEPWLAVELVTSPQTVYVNRREADIFVSFFQPPGQGLVSERVGRFKCGLYASRDYLAANGTPSAPAELTEHWFVTYIEDLIQVDSVRWLADVVSSPRIAFHSNSMIAQLNAAAGGLGIVMLPRFAAIDRPDLLPVLEDQCSTSRDVWLNIHGDLQFAPRIRIVARFIKATLKNDPFMQEA